MSDDEYRSRRVDDEKVDQITKLLEQEDDPKTRGTLTLIQCLVEEILAISLELRKVSKTLKDTTSITSNHEKLVQRVSGAMTIVLILIGPVQIIALAATGYMFTTVETVKREVVIVGKENEKLEAKLQAITERFRKEGHTNE